MGIQEQRNTRYEGIVGIKEKRVQWNRGSVGTQKQNNSGYTGTEE